MLLRSQSSSCGMEKPTDINFEADCRESNLRSPSPQGADTPHGQMRLVVFSISVCPIKLRGVFACFRNLKQTSYYQCSIKCSTGGRYVEKYNDFVQS